MLGRNKKGKRAQFLPSLPSSGITSWVASQQNVTDAAVVTSRSSSSRDESNRNPACVREETTKRKRPDMPVVRGHQVGAMAKVLRPDFNDNKMRGALEELVSGMYANSSQAPRDSLLVTWFKFHARWFGDAVEVLPLTEDKILKISSLFKAGAYKSYKSYMSRAKDYHAMSGYDWTCRLDLVARKCARSVLRGLGSAARSDHFDLMKVFEAVKDVTEPLAVDGPINPAAFILTSTVFMLREVEASASI